ncbi:hypothetical protein [Bacillus testis]|uniref:hypothetical protein n=1 Tax=Bacillus testis TaxID=1622072 RepID=UPI00067EF30E|nr:hypothetical protein [Bacillus testis]
MPKIHRIRIAGLKYDGMQKQYANTIFDFHNDEGATNGLIALMNGGGKGVLLQTIFQVLKPGTTWGEENNRHYQQFFYNKQEQFVPYTFHVAIEWELDGSDKRHLISGGIFSAAKTVKMRDGDEAEEDLKEESITPIFHFYAKEFAVGEGVDLAEIPLYKDGQALSAEEVIGDFLQWQGYYIYKKPAEHYKLLSSYGINRKDWDIIKDINLTEGGVGKYFEGAEDDHALFQKRIIPTVSQVIKKHDSPEDDLVEIFKNQASIAKDLPILLKREQAHTEFLNLVIPFEQSVEKALENEEKMEAHVQKGRQVLAALEYAIQSDETSLKEVEKEVARLESVLAELRFQKDNLEYAKIHRQKEELEKSIETSKEKHQALLEKLAELRRQKEEQVLLISLKEWEEIENTVQNLLKQKESLEQSDQLVEVNERMDTLKSLSIEQWQATLSKIQEDIKQYEGFKKHLYRLETDYKQAYQHKVAELETTKLQINQLQNDMADFEAFRDRIYHEFGDKAAYAFPEVLEEYRKKVIAAQEEKEQLELKEKESQKKQSKLATNIGKLQQMIEGMELAINNKQEELGRQIEKEEELAQGLYAIFKREVGTLNRSGLSVHMDELDGKLLDLAQQLEHHKRTLWEAQLDQSLNAESFWIPNKDIRIVKEWIDDHTDIDVFYGTQFLQSLPDVERSELLESYPLLPFGLVMKTEERKELETKEWKDLLLRSPVPLFGRDEMKGTAEMPYWIVRSGEQEIVLEDASLDKWKNGIAQTVDSQVATIAELDKSRKALGDFWRKLDKLKDQKLSDEISLELETEKKSVTEQQNVLQKKMKDQQAEIERQLKFSQSVRSLASSIALLQKQVATLEEYEQQQAKYEEWQLAVKSKQDRQNQLVSDLKIIEGKQQDTFLAKDSWHSTYVSWKVELEHQLKKVMKFLPGQDYPNFEADAEESEAEPQLSLHILDELLVMIQEMEQLEKSKEERVQELKVVQAQLEHFQQTKTKHEQKMADRTSEWKATAVPTEPVLVLERQLESLKKEVAACETEEREQSDGIKTTIGTLGAIVPQLEKSSKKVQKHGKQPEEWEDLNLELKEIQLSQESNETQSELSAAQKLLEETQEKIRGYESNKNTLSAILEEPPSLCMPEDQEAVHQDAKKCVDDWIQEQKKVNETVEAGQLAVDRAHKDLKKAIEDKNWEPRLKKEWLSSLNLMNLRQHKNIHVVIIGMKRFSMNGLEQLEKDKERAMKAQEIWAVRASMKVMKIAGSIRMMVGKMKFKNESGHQFPLVKFKEDILPKKAEDVEELLKQHFVHSIDQIITKFDNIDGQNKELMMDIKKHVSDEKILFVSLRNRYPELLVYNMRTDNAFMYKVPSKEHYSTWRTINQGSKTKSDGSGGQKLSARMVMMMMLLSVKNETDHHWVTLLCDNPFGQAASTHVLDPIFTVAEKLRFQLIVVTPPELVKTEISQRFNVFYKLDFKRVNGKEIIHDTVVPMYRIQSHS